jgi:hypothetical protein
MMRAWVVWSILVGSATLAAHQPPPATPSRPGTLEAAPSVWLSVALPGDRPERLMAAQQLAMAAYPELRTQGLQLRVDESASATTITIGFAERDRDTVLAVSRPREAMLVIEATFDPSQTLTRALLRGTLAHTAERRRVKALTTGVAQTLAAEGAAFGPTHQAALLDTIDLARLRPFTGAVAVQGAVFLRDASDDGVFWQVAATTATGEAVTLGFEPYAGRLVRFARGGGQ